MAIGLGIVLIVVGLIFGLDVVNLPSNVDTNLDSNALGWILVAAGVLALVLSLVVNQQRTKTTVVNERRTDLPPQ
jgi:hypothetical protein